MARDFAALRGVDAASHAPPFPRALSADVERIAFTEDGRLLFSFPIAALGVFFSIVLSDAECFMFGPLGGAALFISDIGCFVPADFGLMFVLVAEVDRCIPADFGLVAETFERGGSVLPKEDR